MKNSIKPYKIKNNIQKEICANQVITEPSEINNNTGYLKVNVYNLVNNEPLILPQLEKKDSEFNPNLQENS